MLEMKSIFASAALSALIASPAAYAASTNAAPRVVGDFIVNVSITCPTDIFQNVVGFLESPNLTYPGVVDVELTSAGATVHELFSAHFSGGQSGTVLFIGAEDIGTAMTSEKNLAFKAEGQPITTVPLLGNSPYALAGSRYIGAFSWKIPNTDQIVAYTAYFNNIDSTNTARTIVFQGRPVVSLNTGSYVSSIGNCTAQGTAQAVAAASLP